MSTPKILEGASRQYRHNWGSEELICGFDKEITIEIISKLQAENKELKDKYKEKITQYEIVKKLNKTENRTSNQQRQEINKLIKENKLLKEELNNQGVTPEEIKELLKEIDK